MYRNSYQRGMLTVFFSCGSKPLEIWETKCDSGYITRFLDQDIKAMVLEIGGTNVSTTFISCPKGKQVLGITMPFLVMIVKNLKKYFSFEVTILDETGMRRRFRVSNFQSNTQIMPMCTCMPIGLSEGWNQIQFNLAEFTRRAYKKQFIEVQKLKINANIRLRRVYFAERLIPEDQLPPEYKLYFPLASKGKGKEATGKKDMNQPLATVQQTAIKGSSAELKSPAGETFAPIKEVLEPPPPEAPIQEVLEPPPAEAPIDEVSEPPVEDEPAKEGESEAPVEAKASLESTKLPPEADGESTVPSEPGTAKPSKLVTEDEAAPTEAAPAEAEADAPPTDTEPATEGAAE